MKKSRFIPLILALLGLSVVLLYGYRRLSDHRYVSEFLFYQTVAHSTFFKEYPLTEDDLLGAKGIHTFWINYDLPNLYWDSSRIEPYLKNFRLVHTPDQLIMYYDRQKEGIVDLSKVNFLNYFFTNANFKYFELETTFDTYEETFIVPNVIIIKDYRMADDPMRNFNIDLNEFHSKFLNFQGYVSQNANVYLQVRNYKGTYIYHIIHQKGDVSSGNIDRVFKLLNKNVLKNYQGYDIINVPLVIGDSLVTPV